MRRFPIYFLIDVSESMVGDPIKEVEKGMRAIIQELRTDPYALETVFVSIIAFAGKAITLSPLQELYVFYPPTFPVGGGTSLGSALNYLMDDIDRNVQKTTMQAKGDWKPLVFLFTDGNPTDNYSAAFKRWNERYRRHCNLVAISIGQNMNVQILGQITENVLLLRKTDSHSFSAFFRWVTASIISCSQSISDDKDDSLHLSPHSHIDLEKADTRTASGKVDENYAVVLAKCGTTNRPYLMKYARRLGNVEDIEHMLQPGYRLVGAYPIDADAYAALSDGRALGKNINTNLLAGSPACPCCGNQYGFVVCQCGKITCGDGDSFRCGWCGVEGTLYGIDDAGMNINRAQG